MRVRSPRIQALASALAVSLTLLAPATAQAGTAVVRNPGDPRYVVSLTTGTQGHVWTGRQSVSFTNLEAAPLATIYLRTWSNGVLGCGAHSITVTGLMGGSIAGERLRCTELEITLNAPLAQGERTTLGMRLRIEVPPRNDRFGYHQGLALLGTALPTLEVHDDQGWHHDPFVDMGESFYSIVGRYRVTLNTPAALDTPTTGVATSTSTPKPGRRETTYTARDVRDFAWAAGRLRRVVANAAGTRIVASYQPEVMTRTRAEASLRNAKRSLNSFSNAFGMYPYRELDVVLAGFASFGGMEYPTIVFTNPERFTISHELAHQVWYGIVGNNEFADPWLDESFATWSQYLPFTPWTSCRRYFFDRAGDAITNGMQYWVSFPSSYGTVYDGGGCMLANLAGRFGLTRFVHILGRYAGSNWLDVSRTDRFQTAIEAAATRHLPGLDMNAYWARWRVD